MFLVPRGGSPDAAGVLTRQLLALVAGLVGCPALAVLVMDMVAHRSEAATSSASISTTERQGVPALRRAPTPRRDEEVKDVDWILDVDRAGWVAFTKDERITRYPEEQEALARSTLRVFPIGNQRLR